MGNGRRRLDAAGAAAAFGPAAALARLPAARDSAALNHHAGLFGATLADTALQAPPAIAPQAPLHYVNPVDVVRRHAPNLGSAEP